MVAWSPLVMFWRRQCVISSKNYGASPWKLPLSSAAGHQSRSLYHKIRRYAQYLRNFDRPLGLPGHLCRCFLCRQRVISSKKRWRESEATAVAVSRGASVATISSFAISRNICNHFACSFRRLFYITSFRILHNTNTHHQMEQQWRSKSWHLQP